MTYRREVGDRPDPFRDVILAYSKGNVLAAVGNDVRWFAIVAALQTAFGHILVTAP